MKRLLTVFIMTIVCYGCFIDSLWSDDDERENPEKIYRKLQE